MTETKTVQDHIDTRTETPVDATPHIVIREEKSLNPDFGGHLVCDLYWTGVDVDRPHTSSISLLKHQQQLAERYQRAVADGKIYTNPRVTTDVNGQTYIVHDGFVMGKYLNEDLQSVGY